MTAMTLEVAPIPLQSLSKVRLWTSRAMTGLPALFLAVDGVMKLVPPAPVVEASAKLGFQRDTLPVLGVVLLASVALTFFRRTRVFGAVLVSAYLGGAVAIHVQQGDPLFSHTLFPIYFAALLWGGLALRDERVRALSPFSK